MGLIDLEAVKKIVKARKAESHEAEIIAELNESAEKLLEAKLRELKSRKRLEKLDQEKERNSAVEVLTAEEIRRLPAAVQADIEHCAVIGRSRRVVQARDGRKYHLNNKLNNLSGGEWTYFLNSVINTRYPTSGPESYAHHIRRIHPSPKPPQLTRQIIEFFTREGEIVFDYFMGVGGTLLGASLCHRRALGIDLNPDFLRVYREACQYLGLPEQPVLQGDSAKLLRSGTKINQQLTGEKVSLILLDPPYGDMMARPKTGEAVKNGGNFSPTPYSDLNEDLGNMPWTAFLQQFHETVVDAMKFLRSRGHLVIFFKDLQPKGKEVNLLHADLINDLNQIPELQYLGARIWADQTVNLYPYGYPFSFVANQIHQYIMVFRKS